MAIPEGINHIDNYNILLTRLLSTQIEIENFVDTLIFGTVTPTISGYRISKKNMQ